MLASAVWSSSTCPCGFDRDHHKMLLIRPNHTAEGWGSSSLSMILRFYFQELVLLPMSFEETIAISFQ